jgi:hypothetical protein
LKDAQTRNRREPPIVRDERRTAGAERGHQLLIDQL